MTHSKSKSCNPLALIGAVRNKGVLTLSGLNSGKHNPGLGRGMGQDGRTL